MNKQHFIERLNLHLDGELNEEESKELLAVARENPEYQRIYVQYCQLFNACSQLGDRFATSKKAAPWRQKAYAVGGMAAAFALLFLAARNLTPLLGGLGDSPQVKIAGAQIPSQALGDDDVEPLLVMDGDAVARAIAGEAEAVPVSFPTRGTFERSSPINFGTDADVQFVHLVVSNRDRKASNWKRSEFTFGDAIQASTYDHEALSAEEPYFSVSSLGDDTFGENDRSELRFELSKAAAVAAPPKN